MKPALAFARKGRRAALEVGRSRRYGRPRRSPKSEFRGNPKRLNNKQELPAVRRIYKICPASAWREAERQGVDWEHSRNDELFPHLYGELDLGAVLGVLGMRARSDGTHDIPELTP